MEARQVAIIIDRGKTHWLTRRPVYDQMLFDIDEAVVTVFYEEDVMKLEIKASRKSLLTPLPNLPTPRETRKFRTA